MTRATSARVVYGEHHLAIQPDGGTTVLEATAVPRPIVRRAASDAPPADQPELIGRDDLIAEVAEALRTRTPIQLYGPRGVGCRSVLRAALRHLHAEAPETTTVNGSGQTLGELVHSVFEALYDTEAFRPGLDALATIVADARAWVVIEDCDLPSDDVERLLAVFPGCAFALISRTPTLRRGVTLSVPPLSEDDSYVLVETWIDSLALGVSIAAIREGCRQAGGIPQRLAMYVAFLQVTAVRPELLGPSPLTAVAQAAVLIAALSAPARMALSAMAALDADGDSASLAALVGAAHGPDLGAELASFGLATRSGTRYRATDAARAALARQPAPPDPAVSADGLRLLLGSAWLGEPVESPRLLLAVVRAAVAVGADGPAGRLARESAPRLLLGCHIEVWAQMIAYATIAARRSPEFVDAVHFAHEDQVRTIIAGGVTTAVPLVAAVPAGVLDPPARPHGRIRTVPTPRGGIAVVLALILAIAIAGVFALSRLGSGTPGNPAAPFAGSSPRPTVANGPLPLSGTRSPSSASPSSTSSSAPTPSASSSTGPQPLSTQTEPQAPPPSGVATPSPSASASKSPAPPPAPPATDPASIVKAFYADVNRQDYRGAWNLGGNHLGGTYVQFVAGFDGTANDTITIVSVSGDVAQVGLSALQTDGTTQHWAGSYTVTGGVIVDGDLVETD